MSTQVPKLLKVEQAAPLMGIAPWRLYELLKRNEGPPSMRIGRSIRISEAALAEWIEAQHAAGGAQ
jgi:excisionase family DNA binding protein